MERNFIALKGRAGEPCELKTVSEEQLLLGLQEPNKLIYRFDEQTKEEFNITDEQTIRRI
jgi:hypothetical protein